MPAYTAILALTANGYTSITHLNRHGAFTEYGADTLVFKNVHGVRDKVRSLFYGPINTPKPGFIKGSIVQYRALALDPDCVQWPIGQRDDGSPEARQRNVNPNTSLSMKLAWKRRRLTFKADGFVFYK